MGRTRAGMLLKGILTWSVGGSWSYFWSSSSNPMLCFQGYFCWYSHARHLYLQESLSSTGQDAEFSQGSCSFSQSQVICGSWSSTKKVVQFFGESCRFNWSASYHFNSGFFSYIWLLSFPLTATM